MNRWIFWVLSLLLLHGKAVANPHNLSSRDESAVDDNKSPNFLNGLGGAASLIYQYGKDFIDGTDYNYVKDFLYPPKTVPPITNPTKGDQLAPGTTLPGALDTGSQPEKAYNLHLSVPIAKPNTKSCDENTPEALRDECQVPTLKMVYAVDCGKDSALAKTTNQAVTRALQEEVARNALTEFSKVETCTIPNCGVLFWAAYLTQTQMLRIGALPGVKGIASNRPMKRADDPNLAKDWSNEPAGVHQKRAVRSRPNEFQDLAFISTALGETPLRRYHFLEEGGEGVTGYVVGEGMRSHSQIPAGKIRKWLYAADAVLSGADGPPDYIGTCHISKLIGFSVGMLTKAEIIIVKTNIDMKSFLFGLVAVAEDLTRRSGAGEELRGFNVLHASLYCEDVPNDPDMILHVHGLRIIAGLLIHTFQLPIVVPAGNTYTTYNSINVFPAKLALDEFFPLIVVGGINLRGQLVSFSMRGPPLTICAPSVVQCARFETSESGRITETIDLAGGTGAASILTAGLGIYFLSIADVRNRLLGEENLAVALRNYIVLNGYVRTTGDTRAIWNGLDPTSPDENYGWRP